MPVKARLTVLLVISGAASSLIQVGLPPLQAVVIALLSAAGAVEVGRRLTSPGSALNVRVVIVTAVVTTVVSWTVAGYPPFECLAIVLLTAGCATEIGRRLTGEPYRLPTWSRQAA